MGNDVRLQNELLRYQPDGKSIRMREGDDFDKFLASADNFIKTRTAEIERLCDEHPLLSTRFRIYYQNDMFWEQARDIGQSRFRAKSYKFPDNIRKYINDDIWTKLPEQLTLHRNISIFFRDYLFEALGLRPSVHVRFVYHEHLSELLERASNDEERDILVRWGAYRAGADSIGKIAKTEEEYDRMISEYSKDVDKELFDKASEIFLGEHVRKVSGEYNFRATLKDIAYALDSLHIAPLLKDIYLCLKVYNKIDQDCRPLPEATWDTLKTLINSPLCLEWVEHKNNNATVLTKRKLDELVLKPAEELKNVDSAEGEALLKQILAPLKGKFVLLDRT